MAEDKANKEHTIVKTADGSQTLMSHRFGQHYHSIHGAIQESEHVFIQYGLNALHQDQDLNILEIGLGTGLNALLLCAHRAESERKTRYVSYEAYPLSSDIYSELDYCDCMSLDSCKEIFAVIHASPWSMELALTGRFIFKKVHADVLEGIDEKGFDLVIFDAFSPNSQPELWSEDFFRSIRERMNEGGILSTYCSKGDVRRALLAAGFKVVKQPGPPGKREMLQAFKS